MISIACEVISVKYGAVDNLIVCLRPGWAWPRRREIQILISDLDANVHVAEFIIYFSSFCCPVLCVLYYLDIDLYLRQVLLSY